MYFMNSYQWGRRMPNISNRGLLIIHKMMLTKIKSKLADFSTNNSFFIIYFDAFDPNIQPELWTKEVFEKLQAEFKNREVQKTYTALLHGKVKARVKRGKSKRASLA